MTSALDRALAAIDAGLQTPAPDPTHGEVSPRNRPSCARCDAAACELGSDFCARCRSWLLGGGDDEADARKVRVCELRRLVGRLPDLDPDALDRVFYELRQVLESNDDTSR